MTEYYRERIMVKFIVIISAVILFSVSSTSFIALADQTPPKEQVASPGTSPVILGGKVLFYPDLKKISYIFD